MIQSISYYLSLIGWKIEYFNYWLTHMFYFTGGLFIIIALGINKYEKYRTLLKEFNNQKHRLKPI